MTAVLRRYKELFPAIGDRVMIEARQGNLSIQTVGVTKSHGEMGQTITVSNVDSGKELRATVVAPGVVRVTF